MRGVDGVGPSLYFSACADAFESVCPTVVPVLVLITGSIHGQRSDDDIPLQSL